MVLFLKRKSITLVGRSYDITSDIFNSAPDYSKNAHNAIISCKNAHRKPQNDEFKAQHEFDTAIKILHRLLYQKYRMKNHILGKLMAFLPSIKIQECFYNKTLKGEKRALFIKSIPQWIVVITITSY
ncbi:unnamed protein product [Phytomonas sp. EM1]|nr:unnamed protein product [Phytomonas sp. EM1]|eukprot:CCW63220.1 unnamed protein product [Phytomonas sp. isolate EM1]